MRLAADEQPDECKVLLAIPFTAQEFAMLRERAREVKRSEADLAHDFVVDVLVDDALAHGKAVER